MRLTGICARFRIEMLDMSLAAERLPAIPYNSKNDRQAENR